MARLLYCVLVVLAILACHEVSGASVSTARSLKNKLRQPTTPATPAPAGTVPNPLSNLASSATSVANNIVAAFKGVFAPVAAQLKSVFDQLKLGKPDNKPKGDTSFNAQLAATATKGLDKDAAKGTQYFNAISQKAGAAGGEVATYVQNALKNLKAGGPQVGPEKAAPALSNGPGKTLPPAAGASPADASGTPPVAGAPTTPGPNTGSRAPAALPGALPSALPGARTAPAASSTGAPLALIEEQAPEITEYHVVFRAFIPGAGTRAIAGVNTKSMTLDKGTAKVFNGYKAANPAHSFAGFVIGIYETDEIFNTNHRDWSTDIKGNDESKTFVYIQLQKQGGTWKKKSVSNGSSRTEHYCNGIWASWVQFWPTGLCCNDKATWEPEEGFSGFKAAGNKVNFKIAVRKGNPCVPGSYIAGPIMHSFDVEIDFAANKFSYSGKKSQFPALEVCHGTSPKGFRCHIYDVKGKSVFDLMGFQQTVDLQTMELFQS